MVHLEDDLLTEDEEVALAERIASGDLAARDTLILKNQGLVGEEAKRFKSTGIDMEDLKAYGQIGLILAADRFDPYYGVRFSSYAGKSIRSNMLKALIETGRPIRLPVRTVKLLAKWLRAQKRLNSKTGLPPTEEQIAETLGLSPQQVDEVREAIETTRFAADSSQHCEHDYHYTPGEEGEDQEYVQELIECLNPREQRVISLHFGIGCESSMNLKQIGHELRPSKPYSREYVRQIRNSALETLRSLSA